MAPLRVLGAPCQASARQRHSLDGLGTNTHWGTALPPSRLPRRKGRPSREGEATWLVHRVPCSHEDTKPIRHGRLRLCEAPRPPNVRFRIQSGPGLRSVPPSATASGAPPRPISAVLSTMRRPATGKPTMPKVAVDRSRSVDRSTDSVLRSRIAAGRGGGYPTCEVAKYG